MANAPHIPVHLGAMQEAVKFQIEFAAKNNCPLKKGDVLLSNHPQCGGSHLPDLTVITPVFSDGFDKPIFYVANRGHHADIGQIIVRKTSRTIYLNFFNSRRTHSGIDAASVDQLMARGGGFQVAENR